MAGIWAKAIHKMKKPTANWIANGGSWMTKTPAMEQPIILTRQNGINGFQLTSKIIIDNRPTVEPNCTKL